jgi:hypothetical protein
MFYLLYSPKQKIVKMHGQKQIGKSHVIDMERYGKYLTLYFSVSHSLLCNKSFYVQSLHIINLAHCLMPFSTLTCKNLRNSACMAAK